MSADRSPIRFLAITALLFSTLACRAATRMIVPDTPTPLPTFTATNPPTATPTPLPTWTPTVVFQAACPGLLEEVLASANADLGLPGKKFDPMFQEEGSLFLVDYTIREDKIGTAHIESVPDEWEDERDDRETHAAIWEYFASIIPAREREFVSEFSIFTDGRGNYLAAVSPVFTDPEKWILRVDILDSENYYDLSYTLIHEQGHLLTLNAKQVPPSDVVFDPSSDETAYEQQADACPQYFTGEGCSEPASYINQFFDRFWTYLYPEWQKIDLEEDKEDRTTLLKDFYKTYKDQFLSDYAPTSPAEDIAESWAFFVLSPKPENNSIANEKILFFYEYPELVDLRTQILKNICAEFPGE